MWGLFPYVLIGLSLLSWTITLLAPWELRIWFSRKGQDDHLSFAVRGIGGLVRYAHEFPMIHATPREVEAQWEGEVHGLGVIKERIGIDTGEIKERIQAILRDRKEMGMQKAVRLAIFPDRFHFILKRIPDFPIEALKNRPAVLNWRTRLGMNDAPAVLGPLTGGLWAAKASIFALLSTFFHLDGEICVEPDFDRDLLELEVEGIISVRLGDIILAWIKQWWNRERRSRRWRIIPSRG